MTATYFCQWWSPTRACPDMFSTALSSNCFSGQPEGGSLSEQPGSQLPHSGKRFAGIFTYGNTTGAPPEYREYISAPLLQPLIVGKYYRASMYVSCANRMVYAANNMGFCFTIGGIQDHTTNQVLSSYQPQIVSKEVITSTQWVRVCGIFKANSAANVVMIGNFSSDATTSTINRTSGSGDSYYYGAFYFIDDVTVEQVNGPDANLGLTVSGNERVCDGDSTMLTISQNFDLLKWSTWPDTSRIISTGSVLKTKLQNTTTIIVSGSTCGVYAHDTITVTVDPTPKITLGKDTTLCLGNQLRLDPGGNYSTYLWQDQSIGKTDVANSPGHYAVTVTNNFGCPGRASINVSFLSPPLVDLGKDVFACSSFPKLKATNQGSTYSWSSGSVDSIYYPVSAGKYWVAVKNQCGISSDTIVIKTPEGVFYNNVVTLNGDGKNDAFKIIGLTNETFGSVKIFSRWGETIFSAYPYQNNWPQSSNLPADTYYFLVTVPGCPQSYKGWIEVLK
ncbi:MAG TPA: gliding motility-associated C-terminal domain-containing protein [Cyclobacteriaceae bacterium]|nr:gliding motility-associated C-terminal domain-containing protein [Cyclobacteriaceae bacterium]